MQAICRSHLEVGIDLRLEVLRILLRLRDDGCGLRLGVGYGFLRLLPRFFEDACAFFLSLCPDFRVELVCELLQFVGHVKYDF